jgi:hypothetical protein
MPLRLRATPQSKYRSKRCVIQGVSFHSQKEGARYLALRALEQAGWIRNLELQPRYDLLVATRDGAVKIGHMTLDFRYEERQPGMISDYHQASAQVSWQQRHEDVKSPVTRTTAYRLRKKMVEAIYDITILET